MYVCKSTHKFQSEWCIQTSNEPVHNLKHIMGQYSKLLVTYI